MRKITDRSNNRNRIHHGSKRMRMPVSGRMTSSQKANVKPRSQIESEAKQLSYTSIKWNTWVFGILIFAVFLLIYWRTCCPVVFWWDSAEFVASVATLGIPHPPSFPLYILLGKLFSFFPLFSLAFKLNFLSGIFAALSLSFFTLLFLRLFRIFFSELAGDAKILFSILIMTLFIAGLNYAFWIQAVRAEVYSLNGLIFILMFFCGIKYIEEGKTSEKRPSWLYLFFFIFGLGMGNHHVTLISTLPAFLFLFLSHGSYDLLRPKNLAAFLIFFLLGCSIYLYLPFSALNSPDLNWGNPTNLGKVITSALALKSAKQIGFALDYTLTERIRDAWAMIYSQFTLLPFILSLGGIFFLLRKHFKLFIFFLLLILGNSATIIILPSEFISTSHDFQGYILPVIFAFALAFGVGVLLLLSILKNLIVRSNFSPGFNQSLIIVFSIFFFSISLLPFLTFHRLADLSKNDLASRYGKAILQPLEKNAVVLIDNPNLYFIISALKYGEGYRKDVAVLDRGLLEARWNCEQERNNYPELFSEIKPDLQGEHLFLTLMTEGVRHGFPVYLEYTERDSDLVNFLYPSGHLYRFSREVLTKLPSELLKNQRNFENNFSSQKEDKIFQRDPDAQRMFVYITYRWGLYYEQKGMFEDALRNFSSALQLDPLSPEFNDRIESLKSRIQLAKN